MKSIFEMNGTERAAALLVAMGPDIASEILRHLDEESIRKVAAEMARIESISVNEKEDLIGEFLLDLRKKNRPSFGGENVARDLLIAAFGEEKAKSVLGKLTKINLEKGFEFLQGIDSEILVSFLQHEHPQTITVTLAHLPSSKSAEILRALPSHIAKETALRLARMEKTSPEAVLEIARVLRKKYEELKEPASGYQAAGGVDTLVQILNNLSGDQEQKLMNYFEGSLPDLAREIREKIFTFDNILNLTNQEMRILIDELKDDLQIAKALKGAGDEIRFKFLRNMSRNRATAILSEIDIMGPVRLSDIQEARDGIVSLMKTLSDSGMITVRKAREQFVE